MYLYTNLLHAIRSSMPSAKSVPKVPTNSSSPSSSSPPSPEWRKNWHKNAATPTSASSSSDCQTKIQLRPDYFTFFLALKADFDVFWPLGITFLRKSFFNPIKNNIFAAWDIDFDVISVGFWEQKVDFCRQTGRCRTWTHRQAAARPIIGN